MSFERVERVWSRRHANGQWMIGPATFGALLATTLYGYVLGGSIEDDGMEGMFSTFLV